MAQRAIVQGDSHIIFGKISGGTLYWAENDVHMSLTHF
jgi:hypothetical protein